MTHNKNWTVLSSFTPTFTLTCPISSDYALAKGWKKKMFKKGKCFSPPSLKYPFPGKKFGKTTRKNKKIKAHKVDFLNFSHLAWNLAKVLFFQSITFSAWFILPQIYLCQHIRHKTFWQLIAKNPFCFNLFFGFVSF